MTDEPEQWARAALETAEEAAAILMRGWRTGVDVTKKSRTDLVTSFDLESERLIRRRLEERTPTIPVLAEEEGGTRSEGLTWYCDPLDGTTNFVHGHPFFCVSIGLLDGAHPVAGAVVAPAIDTRWLGWQGGRAERNGEACRVSETADFGDALVATGFPYRGRDTAPRNNFGSFVAVQKTARGVRRCGAAAVDLCLVGDGTYDGYWERALNGWDLAAGGAIVLAAGGSISALDGSVADVRTGDVVATNGRVHEALIERIER